MPDAPKPNLTYLGMSATLTGIQPPAGHSHVQRSATRTKQTFRSVEGWSKSGAKKQPPNHTDPLLSRSDQRLVHTYYYLSVGNSVDLADVAQTSCQLGDPGSLTSSNTKLEPKVHAAS
ncbi:hypothetical protein ISCGN_029683 [Ixodes scapularis]